MISEVNVINRNIKEHLLKEVNIPVIEEIVMEGTVESVHDDCKYS